jgi:peroxiredoxin
MSTSKRFSIFRKPAVLLLSLALGCSLGLNVLQGVRIVQIQTGPVAQADPKGKRLDDVRARDMNGQDATIPLRSNSRKPKIIYFFSPSRVWCQRNALHLNELVAHVESKYDFIGISLSSQGLPQFIGENHLGFPVYGDLSSQALAASAFTGTTPETIVVSTDGTVLASWTGAYEGITKSDIEHFFGCSV